MKTGLIIAAALPLVMVACSPKERVVENPLIDTSNTTTIDISRVEITDSATVLHADARFIPHYWIQISSDSYIMADGKKYSLTGTEGIQADSLFWMPDSGEASFELIFEPIPPKTKSIDFIESDCESCFKLFGIDLTGKTEYDKVSGVPAELLSHDGNATVPDPVFKSGETKVKVHLLSYRPELAKEVNLYVNTLLEGQQPYTAPVDPETGTAEFKFWQYGPAIALVSPGQTGGVAWLAPGEETDLYFDMRLTGWYLVAQRNYGKEEEPSVPALDKIYSSGSLGDLSYFSNSRGGLFTMNLYTGHFADCKMSAEQYTEHVLARYKALSDSIATSGLSAMQKELLQISLKQEAFVAFAEGDFFREHNYRAINNLWDFTTPVPGIDKMKEQDYKVICSLIDINDPGLLMGTNMADYVDALTDESIDWPAIAGIEKGLVPDLRKAIQKVQAATAGTLTEKDLEGIETPFFTEALKAIQANTVAALEALEGKAVIQQTPEVPVEKLFDAIIARHKGKVVLVDFWNTWCAPCRAALKANEPLKDTELKSDDLVWIYIANETSPLVKYKTMIPDIKGLHYRLGPEQWKYLCDKFDIDGIPSYVLVQKDGSYSLRNDFRDHDLMTDTLKGLIR